MRILRGPKQWLFRHRARRMILLPRDPVKEKEDACAEKEAPDTNLLTQEEAVEAAQPTGNSGVNKIQCVYMKPAKGGQSATQCKNLFWPKNDGGLYCNIRSHRAPAADTVGT